MEATMGRRFEMTWVNHTGTGVRTAASTIYAIVRLRHAKGGYAGSVKTSKMKLLGKQPGQPV